MVKARQHRVGGRNIVVHYLVHQDQDHPDECRLGLAVSKAVGNAVTRNRVKRRFRVLAKRYEQLLPRGCDLVIRAKPDAGSAGFDSLDHQIKRTFATVAHRAEQA